MPTIQNTPNGKILVTSNSFLIAGSCCCGGASSCPDGDPEMYVTLFDADYAGGNITWCGETWTNAEVQSGVEKGPVCPTTYTLGKTTTTSISRTYAAHNWAIAGLQLKRIAFRTAGVGQKLEGVYLLNPSVTASYRYWFAYGGGPPNYSGANTGFGTLPNVLGEPYVALNNYNITDAFFGSYTNPSGVTYSWRKGNGW